MIGGLISSAYQSLPRLASMAQTCSTILSSTTIKNPWNLTLSRTNVRYHFPHPNERRRIKRHGWNARMSTLNGRKILMRKILKGKFVLCH